MKLTNKDRITTIEYYSLLGLKNIAEEYNNKLNHLLELAQEITGEIDFDGKKEMLGHTSDFLYGTRSVEELLNLLGLEKDQ